MLPQFGFSEFLLLAAAALIFVGPKDLPVMMRKLGQIVAKGRAAAREFQAAFDDIARQAELDELRKEIEDLKRANTLTDAKADLDTFEREVNSEIMRESGAGTAAASATGTASPSASPSASTPSPASDTPDIAPADAKGSAA